MEGGREGGKEGWREGVCQSMGDIATWLQMSGLSRCQESTPVAKEEEK
jgi:hypothetical protein